MGFSSDSVLNFRNSGYSQETEFFKKNVQKAAVAEILRIEALQTPDPSI